MPHVSQRAVAEACNVDQKTVSRVFLDPQTVTTATRELVLATARRLGYAPVDASRTLATGTVVVLLDDPSPWRSPLHPHSLHRLSQILTTAGVALVHASFPDEAFGDARALLTLARRFHCDALICNYHGVVPSGLDDHLAHIGLPAVWLNRPREFDAVLPDEVAGAHLATTHLLGLGHRRINYLQNRWAHSPTEEEHYSVVERRAGYRLAMREANLEPVVVDLDPQISNPDELRALVARLITGPQAATALVGYSMLPHDLLPWMIAAGIHVPDQVSVVGIGCDPHGEGGLDRSCFESPWGELGAVAANLVLSRLQQPQVPVPAIRVPMVWHPGTTCRALR